MKVKYHESFVPLKNKHHGYTFVPSGYGNPAMSGQKSGRKRYELQWLRMQCNQKAVTQWRNMSTASKNAWYLFAATYPQPSKKDPNVYLSGYQLFVKRNTYKFLHDGINSDFIENPELTELANPDFSAEINDNGMCLDVTEWYLKNFGILPEVGEFLLCRIIPMAADSGQFFAPLVATLEVDEVFVDGLFLSLFFNGHAPGVVFSVYLSRPVHAGRSYNKTKYRYMGCFKPTQFIQLTDTPDEYTGQAGKFVAVKETEDGLEFISVEDITEEVDEQKCGTVIFDEGIEWSHQPNDSYFSFDDTTDPYNKTISLHVNNLPSNSAVGFESGGEISVTKYTSIILYLKLLAELSANQHIKIVFLYEDEHTSSQIELPYSKSTLNVWQPLIIDLSSFTFDAPTFTGVQIFFTVDSGSEVFPEMYIDYFALLFQSTEPDCTCFCLPSGGGNNAFNPIKVTGQDNITADQAAEPLTLIAGTNISLATDNVAKSVTVSSTATPSTDYHNLTALRQFGSLASYVTQYMQSQIPSTDEDISFDVCIDFFKSDSTPIDYMKAHILASYRFGVLKSFVTIERPFDTVGLFLGQGVLISSGIYRYYLSYNGSVLPSTPVICFSIAQRGSKFSQVINLNRS